MNLIFAFFAFQNEGVSYSSTQRLQKLAPVTRKPALRFDAIYYLKDLYYFPFVSSVHC